MNRKQKTLKQALTGAVVKSVLLTAAFGGSFFTMNLVADFASEMQVVPGDHGSVMDNRPVAEGSPAELIQKHDCWTGPAPKDMEGKIPGHVVVTKSGAVAPAYAGSKMVGQALDQIFNGVDHDLTVHGFCR